MRPLLALVVVALACNRSPDQEQMDSPDLAADVASADLAPAIDASGPPDQREPPPDLALRTCKAGGDPLECGGKFVCAQDGLCRPCGGVNELCCSSLTVNRFCFGTGMLCVGCNTTSWGLWSRCEPTNCGFQGQSCCWNWEPYTGPRCGSGPAYEFCFSGSGCVNHQCVAKP